MEKEKYTLGTRGCSRLLDRMLSVKIRKTARKSAFFPIFCFALGVSLKWVKAEDVEKSPFVNVLNYIILIFLLLIYLLIMPKYWGKQIFSLGNFPEGGQKQKTEKILKGLGVAQVALTERWP